jgi:shikimate dehydrogenase
LGLDAIYVKMAMQKEELADSLSLLYEVGFRGLSVTMPLKEEMQRYLGSKLPVNTIRWEGERMEGTNTDASAALDALAERRELQGSRLLILGAGGLAAAVAAEALQRGAYPIIMNRSLARAIQVVERLSGGEARSLIEWPLVAKEGYDLLFHATSVGMGGREEMLLEGEALLSGRVVMDSILSPRLTPLLRAAQQKGCEIVEGKEMFIRQAARQFAYWFGEKI